MTPLRFFLTALYGGLGLAGLLIIAVFLSGGTFGQRCAKLWPEGSPAWTDCVERFAQRHPRS